MTGSKQMSSYSYINSKIFDSVGVSHQDLSKHLLILASRKPVYKINNLFYNMWNGMMSHDQGLLLQC